MKTDCSERVSGVEAAGAGAAGCNGISATAGHTPNPSAAAAIAKPSIRRLMDTAFPFRKGSRPGFIVRSALVSLQRKPSRGWGLSEARDSVQPEVGEVEAGGDDTADQDVLVGRGAGGLGDAAGHDGLQ